MGEIPSFGCYTTLDLRPSSIYIFQIFIVTGCGKALAVPRIAIQFLIHHPEKTHLNLAVRRYILKVLKGCVWKI